MSKEEIIYIKENEISLKEFVVKGKYFYQEVKKKWWLVVVFVMLLMMYNLYNAFQTKTQYNATLSFMLNDESSQGSSMFSSILGQFGLGGESSELNPNKILELTKSRSLAQSSFFKESVINQKSDFLINHLIDDLKSSNEWEDQAFYQFWKKPDLPISDFKFSNNDVANFNRKENKALKKAHAYLVGNKKLNIPKRMSTSYDDETGIMNISVKSINEKLAIDLTNTIFENISQFYIEKAIEKQQFTYQIVKAKTDSIYSELKSKELRLAQYKDSSKGLFAKVDNLTEKNLQREIQKLNLMYGESTKNLEISDFALRDKTPIIQLIDRPISPIMPDRPSKIKAIIMSIILGVFLAIIFIILRKAMLDALE